MKTTTMTARDLWPGMILRVKDPHHVLFAEVKHVSINRVRPDGSERVDVGFHDHVTVNPARLYTLNADEHVEVLQLVDDDVPEPPPEALVAGCVINRGRYALAHVGNAWHVLEDDSDGAVYTSWSFAKSRAVFLALVGLEVE